MRVEKGAIRFERVGFRYSGAAGAGLDGVDLEIAPGETLALVGHSGAGKTTIGKLLRRDWDPCEGRILVDGQDIAGVQLASLRRAIAFTPQDRSLFHRSIFDNIAYGAGDRTPEARRDAVETAARRAQAHDFVSALPEGYATMVGDRGVRLSGGERQRIAIARALMRDAPILVLDEATASLDMVAERAFARALGEAARGRTTIVIAHRLSTVCAADRIVVLERGRIVEIGDHVSLMAIEAGRYRRLVAIGDAAGSFGFVGAERHVQ